MHACAGLFGVRMKQNQSISEPDFVFCSNVSAHAATETSSKLENRDAEYNVAFHKQIKMNIFFTFVLDAC